MKVSNGLTDLTASVQGPKEFIKCSIQTHLQEKHKNFED